MDWTNVVVAVIAFAGTFGGSLAGIRQSNRVVEIRLESLETKVDKHNCLVERMTEAEVDIKAHSRRLGELEKVLPRSVRGK